MTIHAIRRKAPIPEDGKAELARLLQGEPVPISAALCEEMTKQGLKVKPDVRQSYGRIMIVSVEKDHDPE